MNTIKATMVAIALWVTPVLSQETEDPCPTWGQLAATIMELRQGGVSMAELMNVTDNDVARQLVIAAYDIPQYSTSRYKERAITEFANDVMLVCYKEFQK